MPAPLTPVPRDAVMTPTGRRSSIDPERRGTEDHHREKDLEEMLDWMRSGKPEERDSTGDFARIDQLLPKKKGQTPRERAKDIESHLNWVRTIGTASPADDTKIPRQSCVGSIPVSCRSSKERSKDVKKIVTWLRNGKKPLDDDTGEFKRVDLMLPPKRRQSASGRARDIESALDWMRNKGVSPLDEDAPVCVFICPL